MGLQIARKLAPALLAIVAITALLAAERTEGLQEGFFYLLTAIAFGGLIGMVRDDG